MKKDDNGGHGLTVLQQAFSVSSVRHRVLRGSAVFCFVVAALSAQAPRQTAFDLGDATIADLQQRMASGQDTARSLVEKYLARIEAIDRRGPALHSVIEINPDALAIADRLTPSGKTRDRGVPCTASRFSSRTTSRPPTG